MRDEIEHLRDKIEKLESENQRLRDMEQPIENPNLRNRLKLLRKELEDAEDEKQTLKSQGKKLKRQNQELQEDLDDLNNRLKELRNRTQNQVDADMYKKMEKGFEDAWKEKENLEKDLEDLKRKMRENESKFNEDKERLEREKEEAVEKTYKTIVELKTENEDEMEKMRDDLMGKDKIIKSLMEEMKKIKDYISKLEREIFDLSQEKEKLEENLKKVMHEWENEELKRYSSDKQINGKLKGKEEEIEELQSKLQQIDAYHQEAKNDILQKMEFYKKKSDNLEQTKHSLEEKVEKLQRTLKNRREDEGRGSHVEMGSLGVRTIEDRGDLDLGRTKDTISGKRTEGNYEYERRQEINKTVKMDGDLIKMIYTQAHFIEDRLIVQSDSEEEAEEYEQYVENNPQMYDNTQSSNPQQMFANANRVVVDEDNNKYIIESEADDGDKLVAAYMVNGEIMPLEQVNNLRNETENEEYEDDELIENEYSDVENNMYMENDPEDDVGNGNLVAGPVGGGTRNGYEHEEVDYEEGEEDEEEEEEEGEYEEVYEEDFRIQEERDGQAYQRKPALTFGIGKQ